MKEDHNIWNYLFYIYFIKKETPNEYTGVDSYISDMLKKEDIFWFPIGKSLAINQLEESSNSDHEKFHLIFERVRSMAEANKELLNKKKKKKDNVE